ncbi:MAG: hypothetical protein K2J79_02470, partial [Ruminiclostridium sp.]|nr:hypothetical protein [Ruminiclostridium sp.]
MKFTVSMEASENCKANISIGISCYINGVSQKLSCGDKKDQTVLIEKDFEPGDDLKLNVEFDPVVSEEDAGKEQLPITFVTYYNPDYIPTETYTAFGFLRDGRTITKKIIFKEKPDKVSIQTEDNYTELLRTQDNIKKFDRLTMGDGRGKEALQGGKFAGSILKPDENGVIDLTLVLDNYEEGEYLFSLMKNNEIIKFNGGKDLVKVNIKSEHIYAVDIKLEGVEPGDVIQIIEQSPNGENPFSSNASTPFYIVKGSFAFATQDVGNNTPPVTSTDHSSGLTFGYVMLGYIEGEQRLAVMHSGDTEDGRILIYDIDKGQITASLNMSDYGDTGFFSDLGEEQPVEYTVCDWSNLQVLDEGIAVAKYKLTDHGEFSADEEFLLFDKYLKPAGEIKGNYVFSGIITAEVKNILNCEISIDGDEHYHDVYYLYNTDGSGKRKLFELAENERLVNLKTDDSYVYGSIIDGSGMGAACAVDLQSGEMIRNSNKYDIDQQGKIYSAGDHVLFATGKADPYTTSGGSLVIFYKGKGAFREISVASINETEHATLSPDGKRIITTDYYR